MPEPSVGAGVDIELDIAVDLDLNLEAAAEAGPPSRSFNPSRLFSESRTDSGIHKLPVEFCGSGGQYFGVWIVNVLLTLLTAGLFFPWAKARRLRYFTDNTLVDGEPMAFHGGGITLFKGHLLLGVIVAACLAGAYVSVNTGLAAFAVAMALVPALLRSALCFRISQTSWQGLHFRFSGTLAQAYVAMAPLCLWVLAVVVVLALRWPAGLEIWQALTNPDWMTWAGWLALATVVLTPWLLWRVKRYQHSHFAMGSEQAHFRASCGDFYRLAIQVVAVALVCAALGWAAIHLWGDIAQWPMNLPVNLLPPQWQTYWPTPGGLVRTLVPLLLGCVIVLPFAKAQLQNLLWTQTGNRNVRFKSQLRAYRWMGLSLKNSILIVATLGLYWPFATVAVLRLRLQSVGIKTLRNPETLVTQIKVHNGTGAKNAGGDFWGLDLGL